MYQKINGTIHGVSYVHDNPLWTFHPSLCYDFVVPLVFTYHELHTNWIKILGCISAETRRCQLVRVSAAGTGPGRNTTDNFNSSGLQLQVGAYQPTNKIVTKNEIGALQRVLVDLWDFWYFSLWLQIHTSLDFKGFWFFLKIGENPVMRSWGVGVRILEKVSSIPADFPIFRLFWYRMVV